MRPVPAVRQHPASTARPRPRVTTTASFRGRQPVTPPEPEPITFIRQPIQTTSNPGLEAFKSLQPVTTTTEKLRPEEELFNSVFQTQFDENVVSRPRTDPLLKRPLPPRRPQSPRRLEQPSRANKTPIRELPRRPTLPNDPVRLANRVRQPSLQPLPVTPRQPQPVAARQPLPVTPRTNPLVSRPETSTSFPAVTLSQFTPASVSPVPQQPIGQPVQPISRPRIPVRAPPPVSQVTPTPSVIKDIASYDYDYSYDDNYDSSPALVPAIGDYDLNPLTSKVC